MFQELLARIAGELDSRGLPYMVIGGQAVLLYGEPRLTRDIDITLGVGKEFLPRLIEAAAACGLEPIPEKIEEFVGRTMVLPTLERKSGIRVDFIFSFTPYERQAIDRARMVDLGGGKVRFATPEDLIIHKLFAGRPQDEADASSVILKNRDIDAAYIRRWLKEFDASFPDRDFAGIFQRLLGELNPDA
jgi:predicted nucleotidyltransferase